MSGNHETPTEPPSPRRTAPVTARERPSQSTIGRPRVRDPDLDGFRFQPEGQTEQVGKALCRRFEADLIGLVEAGRFHRFQHPDRDQRGVFPALGRYLAGDREDIRRRVGHDPHRNAGPAGTPHVVAQVGVRHHRNQELGSRVEGQRRSRRGQHAAETDRNGVGIRLRRGRAVRAEAVAGGAG